MYEDLNFTKVYPKLKYIKKIESRLVHVLFTHTNYDKYEKLFPKYERALAVLSESDFKRFVRLRFSSFINCALFLRTVQVRADGKILNLREVFKPYERFLRSYNLPYTGLEQLRHDAKCARVVDLHAYSALSSYAFSSSPIL